MIKPMLCKTMPEAIDDPDYIWERKYDGARIIAADGRLWGRSGREKTALFPELDIHTKLSAVLDGEVVSGEAFNGIQHRINRVNGIYSAAKDFPASFEVFDILEADGKNLQNLPLLKRKELLEKILIPTDNVRLAPVVDTFGVKLFELARSEQWEGIIGKKKTGTYLQDKREWLKVKCWQLGKFLVVGYTEGTGWRASTFGALVLSDLKGSYVGSVGTGFNDKEIAALYRMLVPGSCPFSREPEKATWVKPFAVKIQYLEFTNDQRLRFPSFKGVV